MNKIRHSLFFGLPGLLFVLACLIIRPSASLSMGRPQDATKPPAKNFTRIKLPDGYRLNPARRISLSGREVAIDLFSGEFALGMAVYVEIYSISSPENELSVEGFSFDGKSVLLAKRSWGYRCLFGIDPAGGAGKKKIGIEYSMDGKKHSEGFTVQIAEKKFPFSPEPLDLGKYSDVDYRPTPEEEAFINRCSEKKNKVFGRTGQDMLASALSYPRDRHYITSPFWAKRLIMRYRKRNGKRTRFRDRLNIHKGIDLRGDTGDPVYCMAGGKVVIAEPMYYEGNFIVVDHGDLIFSYYMHLRDLKVHEGDVVHAGDLIGHVGSTGLATGPHLHVSLIIQGVSVNPLSLLPLPVRE